MTTLTSRLAIIKPEPPENMKIGDHQLVDAYQKIDAAIGIQEATSFPLSPFIGKLVRRTDLSQTFFWNGVGWVEWVSLVGSVTGLFGGTAALLPQTSATSTMPKTFIAQTGRRFLVGFSSSFEWGFQGQGNVDVYLKWQAGSSITLVGSTTIHKARYFLDSTNAACAQISIEDELVYGGATGPITIGVFYDTLGNPDPITVDSSDIPGRQMSIWAYEYGV